MGSPNEMKAAAEKRKMKSNENLLRLIKARSDKLRNMRAQQEQLAADAQEDYERNRAAQQASREKGEKDALEKRYDWHDNALEGASMGSSMGGPWGALVGGIAGAGMGMYDSITAKTENGADGGDAFLTTMGDVVPGWNWGTAVQGRDGTKESYAYHGMMGNNMGTTMGQMGALGGGIAGEYAGNEQLQQVPSSQASGGEVPDYQLQQPSLGSSLGTGGAPSAYSPGALSLDPQYQQAAATQSNMGGNYQLARPKYGTKKK